MIGEMKPLYQPTLLQASQAKTDERNAVSSELHKKRALRTMQRDYRSAMRNKDYQRVGQISSILEGTSLGKSIGGTELAMEGGGIQSSEGNRLDAMKTVAMNRGINNRLFGGTPNQTGTGPSQATAQENGGTQVSTVTPPVKTGQPAPGQPPATPGTAGVATTGTPPTTIPTNPDGTPSVMGGTYEGASGETKANPKMDLFKEMHGRMLPNGMFSNETDEKVLRQKARDLGIDDDEWKVGMTKLLNQRRDNPNDPNAGALVSKKDQPVSDSSVVDPAVAERDRLVKMAEDVKSTFKSKEDWGKLVAEAKEREERRPAEQKEEEIQSAELSSRVMESNRKSREIERYIEGSEIDRMIRAINLQKDLRNTKAVEHPIDMGEKSIDEESIGGAIMGTTGNLAKDAKRKFLGKLATDKERRAIDIQNEITNMENTGSFAPLKEFGTRLVTGLAGSFGGERIEKAGLRSLKRQKTEAEAEASEKNMKIAKAREELRKLNLPK